MTLHDFLALEHEFRWGGVKGDDCMTFAASWVEACTGIDPAAEFRGTYDTQEGAEELIAAHGGLVALAGRQLAAVGAKRVQNPQSGDVGIVRAQVGIDRVKEVAAIRFGPKCWAALSPVRVIAKPFEHVAVWRLPV